MTEIIIPTSDDAIVINKRLDGSGLNRGAADFLIAKIESKISKKDYRRQIVTTSAILWYEIIRGHHSSMGINEIAHSELIEWIYGRIEHGNV